MKIAKRGCEHMVVDPGPGQQSGQRGEPRQWRKRN